MQEWIYCSIFSCIYLLIFGIGELLYHKFRVNVEYTRKFSHITSGLISLFFPFYFTNHGFVLFLASSFLFILVISRNFNFLNSINAVSRKTYGSYVFPVSVYVVFYLSMVYQSQIIFFMPVLILAISDAIAALAGMKTQHKWVTATLLSREFFVQKNRKTILGTSAFFITSLIISYSLFYIETDFIRSFFFSIIITICCTFVELCSPKGLDNLTIPLCCSALLIMMKSFSLY